MPNGMYRGRGGSSRLCDGTGQAWIWPSEGGAGGRCARLRPHDGARFLRTWPAAAAQTKAGARPPPRGRGGGGRPGWPRPPLRESPAAAARPGLCPARRALPLKDKARGGWAQAEPAGHPSLLPSSDPAPTRTPKLGPTRAWVAARSWGAGAGTAPKCPPRELSPLFPLLPRRRECCANGIK